MFTLWQRSWGLSEAWARGGGVLLYPALPPPCLSSLAGEGGSQWADTLSGVCPFLSLHSIIKASHMLQKHSQRERENQIYIYIYIYIYTTLLSSSS